MNRLLSLFFISVFILSTACNKDEGCSTNSNLNDQCFNLDLELEVQSNVGQTQHTRERMQFIYQFPPSGPQERVRFVINADDDPANAPTNGAFVQFEKGATYSGENGTFTFNGNLSAGGIPAEFNLTFTKVDRENDLVSGTIEFEYSNDFGSEKFTSKFTDVEVSGAAQF